MTLFSDWNEHLSIVLGLDKKDKEGAHYYFFQAIERDVEEKPRKLHLPKGFECPIELKAGFQLLSSHIDQGKNLKPFMSKGIDKLETIDPLFAQWNVRHLHLGERIDSDFVTRTGSLAFARITTDDVYILYLGEHRDWSKRDIIQNAHDNWPFLLEEFKLTAIQNVNVCGSQDDIDRKRAAMVSTYVRVNDGTEYVFGDMTVSGHNYLTVHASGHMMRVFAMIESDIKKQLTNAHGLSQLQLRLICQEDTYIVECSKTGFSKDISDRVTYELERAIEVVRRRQA